MQKLMCILFVTCVTAVVPVSGFSTALNEHLESDRSQYTESSYAEPKQTWNYVTVRKDAHMFWWLYYTTAVEGYTSRPIVIWLQGGPGSSSTGFGNFVEIGPLDAGLQPRNSTWVSVASILFIDNPVGTGYSYVTSDSAFTKDVHQIAQDLMTTITAFLEQLPDFQSVPLYIFSESYGGKMAAAFSQQLHKAVESKTLKCDFRGFAMGDSWISPIDSVLTWGPYLYSTSLVDETGLNSINSVALKCAKALARGDGKLATSLWDEAEKVIDSVTSGVNVYNILQWNSDTFRVSQNHSSNWLLHMYDLLVGSMHNDDLFALMNGPIRKKLGIIPSHVTWGGQSGSVFSHQTGDFMKPVVNIVDNLLNETELEIVVYTGQLDLIVDTLGTEKWVQNLTWTGLPKFNKSWRTSLHVAPSTRQVAGYVKSYKNFSFYWILDAGHMIPSDAPDAALLMLKKVLHIQ